VANSRGKFLARVPKNGGDIEIVLRDEQITQPNGVTIDSSGNIYIADLDTGNVFKWKPAGQLTSLVELPGGECPQCLLRWNVICH
jgi:sugar lactone lactonase YvrE